MNQTQAIARLRKIIGAKLAYRIDKGAPDAEQREAMRAKWKAAQQTADEAETARAARLNELLTNDATYQSLKAAAASAKKAQEAAGAGLHRHRIEVGAQSSGSGLAWFSVRATGDNWDEVVAKASAKETA